MRKWFSQAIEEATPWPGRTPISAATTSPRCFDVLLSFLPSFFLYIPPQPYLSQIRSLGLGDNGLSAAAIALLAPTLRADPYLRDLDLHGNPLGDEAVEQLFSCIRDNNVLSSLNLADTGIERCDWADQLRVITNIGSLCLANNRIGDEGLVRLSEVRAAVSVHYSDSAAGPHPICTLQTNSTLLFSKQGLEKAFCLRRLDLSNNLFTGAPTLIDLSAIRSHD